MPPDTYLSAPSTWIEGLISRVLHLPTTDWLIWKANVALAIAVVSVVATLIALLIILPLTLPRCYQ